MLDYNDDLSKLYNQKEWYLKYPELSSLIEDWPIPSRVELEGKSLIYDIVRYGERLEPDQATMRREILGGFLELADADDQAVLEYARKWGVLGLCKHGLPASHRRPDRKSRQFILEKPGCTITRKEDWLYESLDRWRYYARLFRSIIALAVELSKAQAMSEEKFLDAVIALRKEVQAMNEGRPYNKELVELHFRFIPPKEIGAKRSSAIPKVEISPKVPGKVQDWQIVLQDSWDGSLGGVAPDPIIFARLKLCNVINNLLDLSGIQPRIWWMRETRFVLSGRASRGFLFSRLAVQLMLLINGSPDYALCSSCSKPILLRKGQSISRRSYCKDCGSKAARREAVKKYYKAERTNPERKKRVRLKAKEVQTIQRLLKKSKPGLVKELAQRYGVSEWAIYKIREGKTWKDSE